MPWMLAVRTFLSQLPPSLSGSMRGLGRFRLPFCLAMDCSPCTMRASPQFAGIPLSHKASRSKPSATQFGMRSTKNSSKGKFVPTVTPPAEDEISSQHDSRRLAHSLPHQPPSGCSLPAQTSARLEIFSIDTDAADCGRNPVRLKADVPATVGFLLLCSAAYSILVSIAGGTDESPVRVKHFMNVLGNTTDNISRLKNAL
ncbi:hypothetical protein B0H19DRAFT_1074260 [Mycena capillaripes]|nr:hypothetical protein B0H19DRAFT_1074260 [Mycena capillaripes]